MEHILQFGINIDEEFIKKRIEEAAVRAVANDLKRDVTDIIIDRYDHELSEFGADIVKAVLLEDREYIIEKASDKLAGMIRRSKQFKEIVGEIAKEVGD